MTGILLDFETADRIVVLTLRENLGCLEQEQREIDELDSVPGYKQADYFANRDIIQAIKKVLSYYGE